MRTSPPDLPGAQNIDSPLDRALTLMLAGERDAALRWSAAVVAQDSSVPSALILTSRLLADAGRQEAAVEGFELGEAGDRRRGLPAGRRLRGRPPDARPGHRGAPSMTSMGTPLVLGSPRPHRRDSRRPPPPLPNFGEFYPSAPSSSLAGAPVESHPDHLTRRSRATTRWRSRSRRSSPRSRSFSHPEKRRAPGADRGVRDDHGRAIRNRN